MSNKQRIESNLDGGYIKILTQEFFMNTKHTILTIVLFAGIAGTQAQVNNIDRPLDNGEFNALVIEASKERLVVIDFWGDRCPSCNQMAPVFANVANEYASKNYADGERQVNFVKINVQKNMNPFAGTSFGSGSKKISRIPTIIFYKNGSEVARHTDSMNANQLRAMIELYRN